MGKLYDSDFYGWAIEQAEALKRRSVNGLDWENLAEEIETLSRSELRELESRFEILLMHLLKWQFQPQRQGRSWKATINYQRNRVSRLLTENPSMMPKVEAEFAQAYEAARISASNETNVPYEQFPDTCPFTLAQAMDERFFPEGDKASAILS